MEKQERERCGLGEGAGRYKALWLLISLADGSRVM